jgi:KUP system potassium uptake protein
MQAPTHPRRGTALALVGALGVVFGDIGTSPLYAMRTILGESGPLDRASVYGVTSTVVWSLLLVVTMLYVGVLLGASNEGEGGLLALLGLLRRSSVRSRTAVAVTILAMAGAAMFLGDSVVTPAISVLSAAEGLKVASPRLGVVVLPVALAILVFVFLLQRLGSGGIGKIYGPVMVVWFAVLALGGTSSLVKDPGVVSALSPYWAVHYFLHDPATAFLSLGAVILAVTGAEALYADLGHFGRAAITRAWLFIVLPALVLSYLGEASAVLRDPSGAANPFYAVVPGWATIPVVVLATLATVIASEAVIAGGFTVLHQAGGLGLFPFLRTRHPSPEGGGRIYLPAANWALAVAVLLVVVGFRSSERLAAAYGVAVASTILATTLLFLTLDRRRARRLTVRQVLAGTGLVVMATFFAATLPKVVAGGWVPVGIGALVFVVMWTWWGGQRRLAEARKGSEGSPDDVLQEITGDPDALNRVPGTAVFLTADRDVAPFALRVAVEAVRSLPEHVVLLSWRVADTPSAPAHETDVEVDTFGDGCEGIIGVDVTLGYRERLVAKDVLTKACELEPDLLAGVDTDAALFLVSEPIPTIARHCGMAIWRQRLFLLTDRLTTDRVEQLSLPRDRTIVIGREFHL